MLIQGSVKSHRSEILLEKYLSLLQSGIGADNILVLVQNSYKRTKFLNEVLSRAEIKFLEEPKIYTFFGLVYNTIKDNWARIENLIDIKEGVISPHLCGLEISEILMKSAIKETGFADYNSKINLLHQLFRRNSLITQNALSDSEVEFRSKILKESFGKDAQKAIDIFKRKTLEYRAFDYLRQLSIFSFFLKKCSCFNHINYLIIDDADEITNAELEFLKYLKPQLKDFYIGYDRFGVSRTGFLNADTSMPEKLEELFRSEVKNLDSIKYQPVPAEHSSFTRRLEMINAALEKIETLIKNGAALNEFAIVTPRTDAVLKFCIEEKFNKNEYQFISGSEKLIETPFVKALITFLKLTFTKREINGAELRSSLCKILKIPVKYSLSFISKYNETGEPDFSAIAAECPKLKDLEKAVFQDKNTSLYEKALCFFKILFSPDFSEQLEKINFFLKQLKDFDEIFPEQNELMQKIILSQLENSIISENPPNAMHINENFLIIATAQKIIDLGIKRKYHIWLDTTDSEWVKEDTGTLYNSWVFQKSWTESEFTYEKNIELSEDKVKRQLRKLSLLAEKEIFAFSSLFDINGIECTSGIEKYFKYTKNKIAPKFNFVPRKDQKPVLAYKGGHLAVSAVPGAGKTTILLALVLKLLSDRINPENIFVLTYMDSAAKNFKERIKQLCPDMNSMPNISTIHGLALRILKENSNFVKVGLNTDFEVCDENQRQGIIREIISKLDYEQEEYEKYEKAISALKLSCAVKLKPAKTPEAAKFLKLYALYNKTLKEKNTLDYDDMLTFSVELLKKNPDVLNYYSDICGYIIEDEAQDSSFIQQKLISLLSKKHKNLIRCGDLNQSITTTFTNADRKGFERFIKESNSVIMNRSQRCNNTIFELANSLIDYSKTNKFLENSFFDSKIQEVPGKNPSNKNAVQSFIFEDYKAERDFIIAKIRKIYSEDKNASIAILTRSNIQSAQYEDFLSSQGFSVVTRSDSLERQPVFRLIYSILKFCEHPWQNENVLDIISVLSCQKIQQFSQEDIEFIKSLKTPFILLRNDILNSNSLIQLHWDLNYWLENSFLDISQSALKIGSYYYSSEIEKSNVYLISGILKKISEQYKSGILEKIAEISKKSGQYKLFDNEEKSQNDTNGIIKIMTYHKSKGDEFDYVFIPELSKEIIKLTKEDIKIKSDERFMEHIKGLNPEYKMMTEEELQKAQAHENLRLLYVAFTRAKKHLYISCAQKYKKYSKIKDVKVSELFTELLKTNQEVLNE